MSALEDLRVIRDALEQVVCGGLPSWYEPTTLLGGDAMRAAQELVKKWHAELLSGAREATFAAERRTDEYRTHCDLLTRRTQALEAEVERLTAELRKAQRSERNAGRPAGG